MSSYAEQARVRLMLLAVELPIRNFEQPSSCYMKVISTASTYA